jgi:hypothetical protein
MKKLALATLFATFVVIPVHASPIYLSCDWQPHNTGQTTNYHFDFVVDAEAGTVDNQPARITDTQILFERALSSNDVMTTVISRVAGTITLYSKSLGLMGTGMCVVMQNRKF